METAREVETNFTLASFLKGLMRDGQAVVSQKAGGLPTDDVAPPLAELDSLARSEAAVDLPELSMRAAIWAAALFYQLCQFTVCRDINEDAIRAACGVACPENREPATDWSVDLVFRHLPRLFDTARHLSNADPLVEEIRRLGQQWPLSSVALPGIKAVNLESFIGHAGLRRIYVDRIIATEDVSRLGDPRIDEQLRADLGARVELAPHLAKKRFPDNGINLEAKGCSQVTL